MNAYSTARIGAAGVPAEQLKAALGDEHGDLRRIMRIGHVRGPPAVRELQRHFSGSDPPWRFRFEPSFTDRRLQ